MWDSNNYLRMIHSGGVTDKGYNVGVALRQSLQDEINRALWNTQNK